MKLWKTLALALAPICATQLAAAQAANFDVNFFASYFQSGTNQVSAQAYGAEESLETIPGSNNPSNVAVTRPNGTVDSLTLQGNYFQNLNAPYYSSLSSLNNAYGLGNYTFNANSGTLSGVVANNYTMWAPVPEITNYSSLFTSSALTGFDLEFGGFTLDPHASQGYGFLSIFDLTQAYWPVNEFLAPATGNFSITPGLLTPGDEYLLTLSYVNQQFQGSAQGLQNAYPYLEYSDQTALVFTTIPEPAPAGMLFFGLTGLVIRRLKRRQANSRLGSILQ